MERIVNVVQSVLPLLAAAALLQCSDGSSILRDIMGMRHYVGGCEIPAGRYPTDITLKDINGDDRAEYAYVASGEVYIIDVSSKSSPEVVGTLPGVTDARGVQAHPNYPDYLYVAAIDGFFIYDLSTPLAPTLVGSPLVMLCRDVAVSGSNECFVLGNYWLRIYNIDNPTSPTFIKQVATSSGGGRLCDGDTYVYIAQDDKAALETIDVYPPAEAHIVDTYATPALPLAVRINKIGRAHV